MGRKCIVPNCYSGYASYKEKISLFKVPANRLKVWQAAIGRKDRNLTTKDCVCEKHFDPEHVIREVKTDMYSYSVKPGLSPNAIPSIFPFCPDYVSKTPAKRKPTIKRKTPAKKKNTIESCDSQNIKKSKVDTTDETT